MAVFSGNPADRATGNVSPGSVREASGVSNGTTRNNNFGGTLGASTREGGFGGSSGGYSGDARGTNTVNQRSPAFNAERAGVRLGPNAAQAIAGAGYSASTANKTAMQINVATAWDQDLDNQLKQFQQSSTGPVSRGIQSKASTGPVPRGVQAATMAKAPARMSGIQDYKSIVPGSVKMTAEKVPFGQKNPSLAKYMGGTPAKPVNVSVAEAKKMAGTVAKTGAYISAADWTAQMGLPASALTKVGTKTAGYGTTTIKAGPATVGLSYPKSVATGRSFGAYTAGPLSSTGPVYRGVQPKSSTGPVSRGTPPASRMSPAPFSSGKGSPSAPSPFSNGKGSPAAPAPKPTVQQVRTQSKEKKAATVASRVTKDGYVYTRVGNRLQNFGAAKDTNSRDANRTRRNKK